MPKTTTLYKQTGSKFLRLSSCKLNLFGSEFGTNLQNQEKSLRRIYFADEGKNLCQCDQAGAEALIVAYLCRHGQLRELFLNNIKPHVFVALHVFRETWKSKIKGLDTKPDIDKMCSVAISELTQQPFWKDVDSLIKDSDNWSVEERYYFIAKQITHSSNYGVGPTAFCLNTLDKSRGKIVIRKYEAIKYLDFYHGLFPEIREWHREVEHQVKDTKILFNLLGDPICFTGDVDDEHAFKEMYAAIPQSTVARITRRAYINMQNFIETSGLDWDMLNDCHDSMLAQCPIDETLLCCKAEKQYMEQDLVSKGTKFKMKSETQAGHNWAPYKANDNEYGLVEVKC